MNKYFKDPEDKNRKIFFYAAEERDVSTAHHKALIAKVFGKKAKVPVYYYLVKDRRRYIGWLTNEDSPVLCLWRSDPDDCDFGLDHAVNIFGRELEYNVMECSWYEVHFAERNITKWIPIPKPKKRKKKRNAKKTTYHNTLSQL